MGGEVLDVVCLVGSLRKNSFNGFVARHACEMYNGDHGMKLEMLPLLHDIPMLNQDDEQATGVPDKVKKMAERIKRADGLIIFTPEYNYGIPGCLKNFIDWASRLQNLQVFQDKKICLLTSCASPQGGVRCQIQLRLTLAGLGAQIMPRPEYFGGSIHQKIDPQTGVIKDQTIVDFMSSILQAFQHYCAH